MLRGRRCNIIIIIIIIIITIRQWFWVPVTVRTLLWTGLPALCCQRCSVMSSEPVHVDQRCPSSAPRGLVGHLAL